MTADSYTVGLSLHHRLCCLRHDHQGWEIPCHPPWVLPPGIIILLLRQACPDILTHSRLVIQIFLDTLLSPRHREALLLPTCP